MPPEDISFVRQNLISLDFDPLVHRLEKECIICFTEFKAEDKVVQLKCHEKHIFHTECIENWVKQGKNSCPVCRKPIADLQNEERNDEQAEENRADDRV